MRGVDDLALLQVSTEILAASPDREGAPGPAFLIAGSIFVAVRVRQESKPESKIGWIARLHLPVPEGCCAHQKSLTSRLLTRLSASQSLRIVAGTLRHSTGKPCQHPGECSWAQYA